MTLDQIADLLETQGYTINRGGMFGGPQYLRISFPATEGHDFEPVAELGQDGYLTLRSIPVVIDYLTISRLAMLRAFADQLTGDRR